MTINVRKPVEARAEAFISNASRATRPEEPGKIVVNIRSDTALRGRIDANARWLGINRSAWLHFAANNMLDH